MAVPDDGLDCLHRLLDETERLTELVQVVAQVGVGVHFFAHPGRLHGRDDFVPLELVDPTVHRSARGEQWVSVDSAGWQGQLEVQLARTADADHLVYSGSLVREAVRPRRGAWR